MARVRSQEEIVRKTCSGELFIIGSIIWGGFPPLNFLIVHRFLFCRYRRVSCYTPLIRGQTNLNKGAIGVEMGRVLKLKLPFGGNLTLYPVLLFLGLFENAKENLKKTRIFHLANPYKPWKKAENTKKTKGFRSKENIKETEPPRNFY